AWRLHAEELRGGRGRAEDEEGDPVARVLQPRGEREGRRGGGPGDEQEVEPSVARKRFAAPGTGLGDQRDVGWYRAHSGVFSFLTQGRRTESPLRNVGLPCPPDIPRSGITRSVPPKG